MNFEYVIYLGSLAAIWAVASLSFQIIIGFAGVMNLGFIALMGIGAYTYSILLHSYEFTPFIALLFSVFAPIPLALFLSVLTTRVKGDYLALMTLWFSFVVVVLLLNATEITRGALGIAGISKPLIFASSHNFFILLLLVTSLVVFMVSKLQKSTLGIVMAATRDDELAAKSLGKNTFKIKVIAFVLSSMGAGMSGALLAMFLGFIDPMSFHLQQLILILTFVIVGGIASVPGTIIATLVLMLVPELLRFLPFPNDTIIGPLRAIVYSVILITILIYRPKGIMGKVELD